ncbi:MAG: PQQ-binding-like beta-propeller repeat protein [Verrucomicrobia bacterium]|nr:PQQ-binding-like beta-propeller repeat protein [Verrucomicrobiota bacterium]
MKIVIIEPDTKSVPYQVLRVTGYVAAVFSLIVAILLIANNVSVTRLDPVHSPALVKLLDELKANPRDAAIREEIRELDLLSRQAFFTSQHFTHVGVALLVGGLVVTVICFKTLNAYRAAPPYPDSSDPKQDLAATALWARKSVTAVGLVLVGFALVLALPWKSPLDAPPQEGLATAEPTPKALPADPASAKAADPATAAAPVTPPAATWPSPEEQLAQWPCFRGAGGGLAKAGNVPTTWEAEKGAAWKSEVPLPGMNSPVVWKDSVFVSGGNATTCEVYCYHAGTGELRWKKTLAPPATPPKEPMEVPEFTGCAASTMATDGTRAFAIFNNGELAAFAMDGTPLWQRGFGLPESFYGYASSLVTFEDLVIVQMDRETDGFVRGIDAATGKDRWKIPREFGCACTSPQIAQGPQGPLLLTAAKPCLVVYDPRTGKELWRAESLEDADPGVSPAYADGVIYTAAEASVVAAIDAVSHQVLWTADDYIPTICTPLITNGLIIYGLTDGGIACLDAKTGKVLWHEDTDSGFYASPVLVGEIVYLVDKKGTFHIFKAQRSGYQSVGSPVVGEEVVATPAVVGNGLFIRGTKHLYRFGS